MDFKSLASTSSATSARRRSSTALWIAKAGLGRRADPSRCTQPVFLRDLLCFGLDDAAKSADAADKLARSFLGRASALFGNSLQISIPIWA